MSRIGFILGGALVTAMTLHGAIPIPVMVITTYEAGKDRGDAPGELQFWAERQDLRREIPVPGVDHPILTNDHGLYAMVSGTTSRCAVQLMALAADPRFDLSHTYFVLCGIAGGDPNRISLGSAVWIRTAVDGDPAFEIDSREIPPSWPYGMVALGATEPNRGSINVDAVPAAGATEYGAGGVGTVAFKLNPALTNWAYHLTKDVVLDDDNSLQAVGRRFSAYPQAQRPPAVLMGESMGADRFYHGQQMMHWAEDWVRIYTRGAGSLAISDCEDQGVCIAFQRLEQMGKVDMGRLLILRTACNFIVPPPGVSPAASLFGAAFSTNTGSGFADASVVTVAYIPALEAAYRVGSKVTSELLAHWDQYRDHPPR
jgi:purine nucleoside permease